MTALIDLVGRQIGRLTVMSYFGKAKWNCLCSCGKKHIILSKSLNCAKPTLSCGCLQKELAAKSRKDRGGIPTKDITGQKFGKLTVVDFAGIDPDSLDLKKHRLLWNCVCSCGRKTALRGYTLTRTDRPIRSCGCMSPGGYKAKKPKEIKFKTKVAPKAVKIALAVSKSSVMTLDQTNHCKAEYSRIVSLVDSDSLFWMSVDILPAWRDNSQNFLDWISKELPPTVVGSRLTRISRYGDFSPSNIKWTL